MATTIAELLIKMGVSVEGAKAAEGEIKGVTNAAQDTDKKGGGGIKKFAATAGKAFAAVGVAALAAGAAIFKLVDSVTSAADEVVKGSKAAGLGTDAYQRLSFAAKISGTNIKAIAIASKTVARGLNDAATKGTGPMVEGLELVGLRIEDVIDLPFEQQLGVFADAISGLDTESEKLAASQLLLGSRAGPQLATLLAEGSEGIKALGDEAARTGGVLGGEALKKSAEFQDSIVRLKTSVGGIVNVIATDLAPMVQEMIDGFKEWTLNNRELITTNIRGFISNVIPVIKALASGIGAVIDFVGRLIELFGGWKSAASLAATATIAFKLALAGSLGPISAAALAISALVSIVAALVNQFADVGESLSEIEQRTIRLRKFKRGKKFANEKLAGQIFDESARRKRLQEQAENEDISKEDRAKFQAGADTSRRMLEELEEKNRAGLAKRDQGDRDRASDKAATKDRIATERARIDASVRVRKKLGKGKRADAIVRKVILGTITEDEAIGKKKGRRGKGGGGAGPAKEPESDVTLAESLLAIRTGTADPKQLKQVIQQLSRKTPSSKSIKPTVAIDFFNFVITQNIKGANPTQIAKESAMAIRGEFEKQTAKAGQTVPTGIAR